MGAKMETIWQSPIGEQDINIEEMDRVVGKYKVRRNGEYGGVERKGGVNGGVGGEMGLKGGVSGR